MASKTTKVTVTVFPKRFTQRVHVRASGKYGKSLLLARVNAVGQNEPLQTGPDEKSYVVAVLNQAIALVLSS